MMRGAKTLVVSCLGLWFGGCHSTSKPTADVVVSEAAALPSEPGDQAWDKTPEHVAALLLQDMVDPRLMKPTTREVRVQALSDGRTVAFRLRWSDPNVSDMPGPARFSDACAVQLPRKLDPDLPAPQMGEAGRPVEITFWRASWQAMVDGRKDTIQAIYPTAAVDHYPYQAPSLAAGSPEQVQMAARYAPARALGNPMAGPRETPVESLLAEGPGTLAPDPTIKARGKGRYQQGMWSVVIMRPLPAGLQLQGAARFQVAFAVWEGSHQETGARKMRTGWIQLIRKGKAP